MFLYAIQSPPMLSAQGNYNAVTSLQVLSPRAYFFLKGPYV